MNDIFYIPRTLHHGGKRVSEQDFFADFKVIIVLAEPGGGKTALLQNVARLTAVTAVRASGFMPDVQSDCLIVDALDEVSRLAAHDISPLLKEIRSAKADRIVLASRSGEWEEADSRMVAAILGVEPRVGHLLPLDEHEQKALFAHEFPAESFDTFSSQVHKFNLQYLLGNPEFLKLFAAVQGAVHLDVLEAGAIREIGRQESWRKTCRNHIRSQVVALFHFPVLVLLLLHDAAEFLIFPLAVKHIDEAHHLLVGTLGDVQLFQSLIIYYITDR